MQYKIWNPRWTILLLLVISIPCLQCHVLHYLHLKKFLTAVAFARALGKKPTIMPIPIPIPIPIAQNEVIKIPIGGNNAKTTILDNSKGSDASAALAQLLGSLSPSSYAGSSSYGYAMPGIGSGSDINLSQLKGSGSNIINLSQLKGSDSNTVNSLASAIGGGSGQTKVLILGGQNAGMSASPSVLRLASVPGSVFSSGNLMGLGGFNSNSGLSSNSGLGGLNLYSGLGGLGSNSGLGGLSSQSGLSVLNLNSALGGLSSYSGLGGLNLNSGMNLGGVDFQNLNLGSGFGDIGLASNPSEFIRKPDMYTGKPRRLPLRYGGRNMRNRQGQSSEKKSIKKPIPVGEKFGYRPQDKKKLISSVYVV